mgnify:CR=1 FL=1
MDSKKLEYYTITLDKTSSKLDLNVDDNTSILDYLNSSSSVDITPKGAKINLSKPTSKKAILKEHPYNFLEINIQYSSNNNKCDCKYLCK